VVGAAGVGSPDALEEVDPGLVRAIFGERADAAMRYAQLLAGRGIEWGLLGPREGGRVWSRHILNCAAVVDLIPDGATVADVGSGAGLPGLVIALARPDVDLTLLEPIQRRVTFLTEAGAELGVTDRVRVVRSRAEDYDTEAGFDVVTSRAVGRLTRLIGWCAPLLAHGGQVLALKGAGAVDEVAAAAPALARSRMRADVLKVRADPRTDPTTVVRLRRS